MLKKTIALLSLDKPAILMLVLCLLTVIPLLVLLSGAGAVDAQIWTHMRAQLPRLLFNTIGLTLGVAFFSLLIGVSLGWLVVMYEFPARRWFEWLLMLPLAVPVYVMAFAQLGLFDYTGPVQTVLRGAFGQNVQSFFPLRSMLGVAFVMSLALYPYVYLLARNAFKTMGKRALEVGQSLGYSPWRAFVRVALPMARPWLAGGAMLAMMETLADFGAVSVFNFDTLTTGVYKAWFALFSLGTAEKLASILIGIVVLLALLEHYWRGKRQYAAVGANAPTHRLPLSRQKQWLAFAWCLWVVTLAFVLPVGQLLHWAWPTWQASWDAGLIDYLKGSLLLSVMASITIVCVALCLSLAQRKSHAALSPTLVTLSTLGYAVPGTVLAVGVFVPVAWLDNWLLTALNTDSTSILKGTIWVMMWAYVVRFLAVGYASTHTAMQRVTLNQERAAQMLGVHGWLLVKRLFLPLMRNGVLTALLLVFVDVMKEMPITLMMRPFGWDTLSVRIFSLTTEGMWQEAAAPALVLVAVGLWPVWYLTREDKR